MAVPFGKNALAQQADMYAQAGVNVDENDVANSLTVGLVRATLDDHVCVGMEGLFSGGYRIDRSQGEFIGQELVAVGRRSELDDAVKSCLRNIEKKGGKPLFLTDYVAYGKMDAIVSAQIVLDIMHATRRPDESFLPIIGGETAEMPGVIRKGYSEILLAITYQAAENDRLRRAVDISSSKGDIVTASIDSVGTKTKLGKQLGIMGDLFRDMVGHSVGDISVSFARPFGVAMYVGHSPSFAWTAMKRVYRDSLGTLADLDFRTHAKGIYCSGQFDIVGSILGILDEKDLLTGKDIEVGDYLVGVKCFGLNTNGYSLVRRLAEQGKIKLDEELPGTGMTVGQALMKSHENYGEEVWKARELFGKHLRGGAHITGGGIEGNTRRLFSGRRDIKIKIDELPANPLFLYLQKRGKINELTMNKTYNRGIGMVYVVGNEPGVDNIIKSLPDRYMVIGRIVPNVKTDG